MIWSNYCGGDDVFIICGQSPLQASGDMRLISKAKEWEHEDEDFVCGYFKYIAQSANSCDAPTPHCRHSDYMPHLGLP